MSKRKSAIVQIYLRIFWILLYLLSCPFITNAFAHDGNELFSELNEPIPTSPVVNQEVVKRQRLVNVRFDLLHGNPTALQQLNLNLFGDVTLTATLEKLEYRAPNVKTLQHYAWLGSITGNTAGYVNLAINGDKLSGTITQADALFEIRNLGDGLHVIRELNLNSVSLTLSAEPAMAEALDSSSALEQQVFQLVNKERAVQGLPAMAYNTKLADAARAQSTDMATRNFFSHTGSDGSSAGDRISRTGYTWNTWGENIAAFSAPESAESVMNRWMNSSGHRANILSGNFCEIGVGHIGSARSIGATYDTYWTQDFARASGSSSGVCPTKPPPPTTPPTPVTPPTPPQPPVTTAIDPNVYYRLTNAFLGSTKALDTYSDSRRPFMGPTGNFSGQFWRFTPVGNGYYRLSNMFLGVNKVLTASCNSAALSMKTYMSDTSQQWKLVPLGDGRYRITSKFYGDKRALDTYSDTKRPHTAAVADVTGQKWKLDVLTKATNGVNQ